MKTVLLPNNAEIAIAYSSSACFQRVLFLRLYQMPLNRLFGRGRIQIY
ncbi:hypothetical protein [Microseira wollei]|nr:hypothetical protein [Microseira wollei]